MARELRERKDIPENYKWNLEAIYSDDSLWEEDYNKVAPLLEKIKTYEGRLTESADTLYEALALIDELERIVSKLGSYAHMHNDEDTSVGKYQSMFGRIISLSAQASAATSFIKPELLSEDSDKIRGFIKNHEKLGLYEFALETELRMKAHVLSAQEEKIIAELSEVTGSSGRAFSMLNNADISFGTLKDENGNDVELTHGNYTSMLESKDRRVREDAFNLMYEAFKNHINTIASLMDSNVKSNVIKSRIRGFSSAREGKLYPNDISEMVYDNLIKTINESLPLLHRYLAIKKKLLGVDELKMYDVYVPIVDVPDDEFSFEKGVELMFEAIKPLGEDYTNTVRQGIENRWIDVYENKGKRSGAYSSGCYDTDPFILLNYDGKLSDVQTLVHEMGHSMHSYYTRKSQPPVYGDYTIFVAEVASTVNENLLLRHLLNTETDKGMRRYLINRFLESFRATVFRQTMFAEFELMTHRYVEGGGTLTADWLCKTYDELNSKYFGPDMTHDDMIQYEWARIPHFYTPFYVYQYATGFSAAVAISSRILSEGEKAVEDYKKFLSTGGSMYPVDELKIAGVDMTSPKPVEDAMKIFEELIDEFEALVLSE